jgi:hypothetical protein
MKLLSRIGNQNVCKVLFKSRGKKLVLSSVKILGHLVVQPEPDFINLSFSREKSCRPSYTLCFIISRRLTDSKVSRCTDTRFTDMKVRRCMAYRQEGEEVHGH